MGKVHHSFFVIFFAVILAAQVLLFALSGSASTNTYYSSLITLLLLLVSVSICITERYKLLLWYFVFAGMFLLAISLLQIYKYTQAEYLWFKVFGVFVLPFSIYVYASMFMYKPWQVLKRYRRLRAKKT